MEYHSPDLAPWQDILEYLVQGLSSGGLRAGLSKEMGVELYQKEDLKQYAGMYHIWVMWKESIWYLSVSHKMLRR